MNFFLCYLIKKKPINFNNLQLLKKNKLANLSNKYTKKNLLLDKCFIDHKKI
jgi:hypothetical protein